MAKLTPEQAVEKHARRLKGSTEDIRRGIMRVTEAPGVAAARKTEKMRTNLIASIDSGKWGQRVASVPLTTWQALAADKGIARIAAGIDGAKEKMTDFYGQLFPFQDAVVAKVKGMPDVTLDDNLNRMTFAAREMSKFKRR